MQYVGNAVCGSCRNGLPTNTSDNQTYIIPRTALPNSKITAYLNGSLVWGSQPVLVSCCLYMTCFVEKERKEMTAPFGVN
jgi:hypothetical protein